MRYTGSAMHIGDKQYMRLNYFWIHGKIEETPGHFNMRLPHNGLPFARVYIEDTSGMLWKNPYTPIRGYFKSAAVNRKWKVTEAGLDTIKFALCTITSSMNRLDRYLKPLVFVFDYYALTDAITNGLFIHQGVYLWYEISVSVYVLTLKRPGLCGWLRPTQFKRGLIEWEVRLKCGAQAFIHALAGCVPRSLQYALCGPRNSRPAHFAAHALDVFATHESPSLTQLST